MTGCGGHEVPAGGQHPGRQDPGGGRVPEPAAGSAATGRVLRLRGQVLVDGAASGPLLKLDEPLSFWGGLDPAGGCIIDRRHPQCGRSVAGHVLLMPGGRGSSSSSTVLAEAIRLGTGPAAILLTSPDGIIVLGALVARELYGRACPVVVVDPAAWPEEAPDGAGVAVDPGGFVHVGVQLTDGDG